MNANERQEDEASDKEEVIPRNSYIRKSSVVPGMRFTEPESLWHTRSELVTGNVRTQYHHSLNIAHSRQHHHYSPHQNDLDVLKVDPKSRGRSARVQEKEYVKKLKDLVETMHSERSEEIRHRCATVQETANIYNTRRKIVSTFLKYHSNYETDQSNWSTIIEESFLLKQPVTPFRYFRSAEIEKEYRFSRGIEAVINDAASLSVMLENIGCHSLRWVRIKRESFLIFEEAKRCPSRKVPSCVERQVSRLYHSISSLSATSSSPSDSSNDDEIDCVQEYTVAGTAKADRSCSSRQSVPNGPSSSDIMLSKQGSSACDSKANKVSSSSGGSGSDGGSNGSNAFQDFQTKILSIQKGDHDQSTSDAGPSSSSGDDSAPPSSAKRFKADTNNSEATASKVTSLPVPTTSKKHINSRLYAGCLKRQTSTFEGSSTLSAPSADCNGVNISNITENGPHLIVADSLTALSDSEDSGGLKTRGRYIINDDDVLSMEDILMCPFIFRSDNAVVCGAFAECVMPGMLRAHFSSRNKLKCLELVYDAMGFIQQLERASGSTLPFSSIPGSLGAALSPNGNDALVITLAEPPYAIINVNEVWTRVTGYTQLDCEGMGYLELLEGYATVPEARNRPGKPAHLLDRVAKGQPACSTNIHYDKNGRDFIEFVCSYPLTNVLDEVTHILHVSKELPSFETLPLQSKNQN